MNHLASTQKKVRLVAIAAAVTAATLFCVFVYSLEIHRFESDRPFEKWIEIGFERRRLELQGPPGDVLITQEYYDSERERLLRQEDDIVSDSEFPGDMIALARYKKARGSLPMWPTNFWLVLAVSVLTAIGSACWLHGASYASARRNHVEQESD